MGCVSQLLIAYDQNIVRYRYYCIKRDCNTAKNCFKSLLTIQSFRLFYNNGISLF